MRDNVGEMCLTGLSAGLVIMMAAIVVQVGCSALDINPVMQFSSAYLVVSDAISLNSLLDFQWHLLVIIGLLPAGIVWLMDKHVRVDFLYQSRSTQYQARINLLGHVVFAAPFFVLMIPASWDFMLRAWHSDEGSRNGGLVDLWLIKAVLPLGIAVLAVAVLIETVRLVRTAQ
jgi:TRAP-type mannitol/chloroaromatic compound transport system permease small subunit